MKLLDLNETKSVSGAMATISGGFSMTPEGITFKDGFKITVTDNSSNVLGNFAAYANKVVDLQTGQVLYDGTQSSFCINGSTFNVSSVNGGHQYLYAGSC